MNETKGTPSPNDDGEFIDMRKESETMVDLRGMTDADRCELARKIYLEVYQKNERLHARISELEAACAMAQDGKDEESLISILNRIERKSSAGCRATVAALKVFARTAEEMIDAQSLVQTGEEK